MDPDDAEETTARILAAIAHLPQEEQEKIVKWLLSGAIKRMSLGKISEMRAEIVCYFGGHLDLPMVREILEIIDGQIALRQIAGANRNWC